MLVAMPTCALSQVQQTCSSEINLLPKYGPVPKCQALLDGDAQYILEEEKIYGGDRRKASEAASSLGWQYFMSGNLDTAMRRFNQAWLLDKKNGNALWGMAAVQSNKEKHRDALNLFAEANVILADNLRFQLDYARSLGIAGTMLPDKDLTDLALVRFESIHRAHPDSAINLENWAMVLYHLERHAEALEKIRMAQKTPGAKGLSPTFIEELQKKLEGKK